MKKTTPASSPNAYVDAIDGWRHDRVVALRKAVRAVKSLVEEIKWGHLVYSAAGPVLLIRAEKHRVLFGFWRGQRLLEIEPRLKATGKYEMATMELLEETKITQRLARRLAQEAVALNLALGDPRLAAKPTAKTKKK